PEYDRHLDEILERLKANDRCSELNGQHQRLEEGAEKLGYHFKRVFRNVDPAKHDVETSGYHGYGDMTGSRQSTVNAFLEEAQALGTRIVVRARAERIVTKGGRAAGVEAVAVGVDGHMRRISVRAPTVVAACGALETPAL